MTAIYIHIPFCRQICHYCDFNKVFLEGQPVDEYIDLLVREMQLTTAGQEQPALTTIYIGGGTPTCLTAAQFERLFIGIRETFDCSQLQEWTIEMNPEELHADQLTLMKDFGVNRLSMGVQTFNDKLLRRIGRSHSVADVYRSLDLMRVHGFDNVNIDLIFRLPNQTLADFSASLETALALDLPHYALYSLILENKTVFYQLMRQGKLPLPDEDTDAAMYDLAMTQMAQAGRPQYEISNFAKPGFESVHNMTYWDNQPYYGFGAGAHGYRNGTRYKNCGPIQHYLKPLRENKLPLFADYKLSPTEIIEEALFLGLRMVKGIHIAAFNARYHVDLLRDYGHVIAPLDKQGLLAIDAGYLRLTSKGIFLGDRVFGSFLGATVMP